MLGVPAEIVIEVAEPAEAWPDPVPPVVHAAIATPITETAIARIAITAARFLLLFFKLKIRTVNVLLGSPASASRFGKLASRLSDHRGR